MEVVMKIGSLIKVHHFGNMYNGKVGVLMSIHRVAGFRDTYSVRIPSFNYEIALSKEQCEVIGESRRFS